VSSRDRDFRPTRRRGLDDDNFEAPRRSFGSAPEFSAQRFEAPSGSPVQAVVKWYNPDKGFGFVQLADGSGDAFLHVSVVERSGHDRQRAAGRDARSSRRSRRQGAAGNRNPECRQQHRAARNAQTRTAGAADLSLGQPSRRRRDRHVQSGTTPRRDLASSDRTGAARISSYTRQCSTVRASPIWPRASASRSTWSTVGRDRRRPVCA